MTLITLMMLMMLLMLLAEIAAALTTAALMAATNATASRPAHNVYKVHDPPMAKYRASGTASSMHIV